MAHSRKARAALAAFAVSALMLLAQAPEAMAFSGSIANVHAVGGEVEATYTTSFDVCTGTYCGWFPHAWQYPVSQPCSPDGSHLTYVGDLHTTSGTETATDTFAPAYSGTIRICLYAYHSGGNYFIAEATFTPSSSLSGSITNVHAISGNRAAATYTTNFDMCTGGYCGWYAHAWQYPASQPCSPGGSHFTYVGDVHSSSGSETATDDFYPTSDAVRICLYAYHSGSDYFVAEALFFRTPAPTRTTSVSVGDLVIVFYYPKSCVAAGRPVQLSLATKPKRKGSKPKTKVTRVVFRLDTAKKTDKRAKWQATFPTIGFVPGSTHQTEAKVTLKKNGKKKVVRKLRKSFRIC